MDYREIIRHKIKEIRKKLHLTQEKFAESIGVEKSHIGQIESGIRNAGPKTINRIIKAHNINPHDFFQTDKKPIRTIEDTRITTIKKHPDKKEISF